MVAPEGRRNRPDSTTARCVLSLRNAAAFRTGQGDYGRVLARVPGHFPRPLCGGAASGFREPQGWSRGSDSVLPGESARAGPNRRCAQSRQRNILSKGEVNVSTATGLGALPNQAETGSTPNADSGGGRRAQTPTGRQRSLSRAPATASVPTIRRSITATTLPARPIRRASRTVVPPEYLISGLQRPIR